MNTPANIPTAEITASTVKTTCPYCGVGCGVDAKVSDGRLIAVSGSQDHPTNRGRLCVKGSSLHETTSLEGRLLEPQVNGLPVSWDQAIGHVADGFNQIIREHGQDAVAFYLSGQILTEDYYVANKLMKGFIGSGNVDTNSRLCMSSAVTAHKRAFGADVVPGCYEDLELADLLILVGSNAAWAHPIVYQRIAAAKQARPEMKVVVIDPRRTATCDIADIHLPLKPGSDGYLFSGLLSYLADNDGLDNGYIKQHTDGFNEALKAAQTSSPDLLTTASQCELEPTLLEQVFDLFLNNDRCVTLFSQGINQSSTGVDKGNAIINCHLASGKIGKPGATPFSITGQPNAMGGREVGGLANQLAAHMDFSDPENIDLVESFWQAPNMTHTEGLKAVDMFRAVNEGKIKAIWIIGTNPVVSMPDSNFIREALQRCELVVVSDCNEITDTTLCANVLLPATTWGEKEGTTTNSERRISRQNSFLPIPGSARHDWQILCDVAKKMGFSEGFNFTDSGAVFREHAKLSGYRNTLPKGKLHKEKLSKSKGQRLFNISALSLLSDTELHNLPPQQWPVTNSRQDSTRLFSDGQFATIDGRARLIPIQPALPAFPTDTEFPLVLNTGRIRDQWHTMTRTGKALRLLNHIDEPYVELTDSDAQRFGVEQGAIVEVSSPLGRCVVKAMISPAQREGSLFMPIHWSDQFAAHARADSLIHPVKDSLSGQPESKHSPVKIRPLAMAWQGVILSRNELPSLATEYWCKTATEYGYRYELADATQPISWPQWLQTVTDPGEDYVELSSSGSELYRLASFMNDRLELLFMATTGSSKPTHNWLAEQFAKTSLNQEQRLGLLSARAVEPTEDVGAIVCACFQVGENSIKQAIAEGVDSSEKLAEKLKCGSNCGSCLPEIKALL
ncbi:nitrate reductase [Amphritea sp. HPY]|uniref:nitrate reductase n=1 Tax=Amphritea sp. HPY TaxID=3421652 RepID=UPI003D7DEAE9